MNCETLQRQFLAAAVILFECTSAFGFDFRKSDHVVILGNTFAERMQHFGYFEAMIQFQLPGYQLVVRNMGWSGDEVDLMPRPLNFGELETHLARAEADVVLLCFGMNESFRGPAGVESFRKGLTGLIARLCANNFNGETPARLVLVSPIAHENLGGFWPDPRTHNEDLQLYTETMKSVAVAEDVWFIDLFSPMMDMMGADRGDDLLTINGIHLNDQGYARAALLMIEALGLSRVALEDIQAVRSLVIAKNKQFFLRWRPVNAEYIFGRRKEPFGVLSFPPEMTQLDTIVAELDARIWTSVEGLRSGR